MTIHRRKLIYQMNPLRDVDRTQVDAMLHNADSLSRRDMMTSLREEKDRSFNKITGK